MADPTPKPLSTPSGGAQEKTGPVSADLLETREFTKTSASTSENLNAWQTAGASAVGASTGGDLGVENLACEPRLEALNDIQKAAADAVAGVRNQLAEITIELSRAGDTVQRFGADFDRCCADWSGWFLRNEPKPASNPSVEPPPLIAAHGNREPGDGNAGNRPGQFADSPIQRAETVLGAPIQRAESAAAAPPNPLEEIVPPKTDPAAPEGAGPVGAAGKPPFASSSGELDEQLSSRVAAAGFEENAGANRNQSAAGKTPNLVDTLNQGGKLEAAQAHLLILLEQTLAGHQRTLDQAVKLIEAQSGNANFALTLLGNAGQQIAAVHARLEQLEAQQGNSRNNQISG